MTRKGLTKDYRVNYSYAHVMGDPTGKPVTGVHVAPYRDAAFIKADEIMRQGERHSIPVGVEIVHVNPDNGGSRSVIHFAGQPVTTATRWEVELYPSAPGKERGTVICDRYDAARNELDARETASNFTRTDQGVATVYRVVKINGKIQREQVAVLVPPHRDEIAEAHRINDALDTEAATARAGRIAFATRNRPAAPVEATSEATALAAAMGATPTPEAIGWELHYEYRDLEGNPTSKRGKITGHTDEAEARTSATRIMRLGGHVDLKAVMPGGRVRLRSIYATSPATTEEIDEANEMNNALNPERPAPVTETAPAPAWAEDWAADVQAAAKLAETLGGELGTSLARMLDQIAFNFRKGQTPTVTGALAVSVRRVADAVTELAEKRAAAPHVVMSPDRKVIAVESDGEFWDDNGDRRLPQEVADWSELGLI